MPFSRSVLVLLASASWGLVHAAPSCRNPLFPVHWSRECSRMCPSLLHEDAAVSNNLTACPHWNGLASCCSTGLEAVQHRAFAQWKLSLGEIIVSWRSYAAGMTMRQLTKVYEYSDDEMRVLFDEALAAVRHSTAVFGPCLLSMLQYAAGMICFMCDPQWEAYLYKSELPVAQTEEEKRYLAGASYDAVAVASGTCAALWAGCEAFSTAARDAWDKILQCPLAKQIEQPLPDLPPFFSKPDLCEWTRAAIALQPLAETSRMLPEQRLPKLPSDASTTTETASGEDEVGLRRLQEDTDDINPSNRTSSPYAWGRWFLVAAFRQPDEVLVAKAPGAVGAALDFDELLGRDELGRVHCVSATSFGRTGTPAELYTAAEAEDELQSQFVVRYAYKVLEGKITLSAATDVWPAPDAKRRVAGLVAFGGNLFVADDEGQISRLPAASMAQGGRTDGVQLYATPAESDGARQPITGLAVSENGSVLFWSTPSSIFKGQSDGEGRPQTIFGQEQLQELGGSSAIVHLASDPLDELLFFAVHRGATSQSCRLSRLPLRPRRGHVITTSFEWPTEQLWISAHSQILYVAAEHGIYSLPVNFSTSVTPRLVFSDQKKLLTSFHSFHVRGTDCVLGDWRADGACTKTCGGGVQKLIRPVLTPAAGGGRPCSEQQVRYKECFDQPCPENATDCLMGQWINLAVCSATCGYGKLHQRRSVLRHAAFGGAECPEEQERSVDCLLAECGGFDFLLAAMPHMGLVSSQLLAKQEKIEWTTSSAVGAVHIGSKSIVAIDSDNRFLYMASSGGESVERWSMSVGDGHIMSFFAKWAVFTPQAKGTQPTIVDFKVQAAALYIATSDEMISRIDEDALLTSRAEPPLVQVLYKGLGRLRSLSVAGTYLLWATNKQVTLGTVDGPEVLVTERPVLSRKSLEDLVGSSSEVVQVELLWDASRFFLGAWDDVQKTMSIFQVSISPDSLASAIVEHQQLRQLQQTWSTQAVRILATPFSAYVYSHLQIWSLPLHLNEDTSLSLLYESKTAANISGLGYFFQKGLDCAVSAWINVSLCSASCGGGLVRQAREILAKASEGGSPCPAELERELPCNELQCPVDCKMSDWKDEGHCSKSCGGGTLRQTRLVLSHPMFGGQQCSRVLEQHVLCNKYPCKGLDCEVSGWMDQGHCSRSCGGGLQRQFRKVEDLIGTIYRNRSCVGVPYVEHQSQMQSTGSISHLLSRLSRRQRSEAGHAGR
ncbi:SPON1 [Symbiodinium natans]|uniref:SPON1 protein n=1 Tax=Symbiodinium natans TaxID=878477 RepID=A0A812TIJ6_9DINO|nr:SPON1 [Symbiodinium natans]